MDSRHLPLVVDLDGTLVDGDTLIESARIWLWAAPLAMPLRVIRMAWWLLRGREVLKARLAEHVTLDVATLRYRSAVLAYLRAARATGRKVVLATAANRRIADAVAAHVPLFDLVLASDEAVNLKGANKLVAIQRALGGPFVYAGDSRADVPIWRHAAAAIPVSVSSAVRRELAQFAVIECEFPRAGASPEGTPHVNDNARISLNDGEN